jgi:hypothetical protein
VRYARVNLPFPAPLHSIQSVRPLHSVQSYWRAKSRLRAPNGGERCPACKYSLEQIVAKLRG